MASTSHSVGSAALAAYRVSVPNTRDWQALTASRAADALVDVALTIICLRYSLTVD